MIKYILFDVDGVIIRRNQYFSEYFAQLYNLDWENEVMPFFTGIFKECVTGNADLKESVEPWLKKWNFEKPTEDFLKLWFEQDSDYENKFDEVLIKLQEKGFKVYLATNQEKYRIDYLLKDLGLQEKVDGRFVSCELGYTKSKPEFFTKVLKSLKAKPEEVVHIDDEEGPITSAKSVGVNTGLYKEFEDLEGIFKNLNIEI